MLLSLTYSCGNSFTHYLPAVFGEGGELVKVTISSIPGTGNVYVGVYPRTGESTQESIEKAINYAKSLSPKESCDLERTSKNESDFGSILHAVVALFMASKYLPNSIKICALK